MGSRIACHFANVGLEVLLLDIAPADAPKESKPARNKIVNDALEAAVKSNPSPLYRKSFKNKISTGNFDDDMAKIASCDWIIEAVVERLDIKQQIFEKVEVHRRKGSLITSNTSGIPLRMMAEGRSDDFKKHFCGTHFFNPPRYLKLLEIIPAPDTGREVLDFLLHYGEKYLGKTTIECKDSPAFIANRIGVFGIMNLFHTVKELGLSVEEIDKLTGPALGRPKSATFRTCDVVGLDTLVHVAKGLAENCPDDEARRNFVLPSYLETMIANKWLGDKTKQGFYKKTKNESGATEILALDLETLEYKAQKKVRFATLEKSKQIENLKDRIPVLLSGEDKAGEFFRKSLFALFSYVSFRVPEISDEVYKIDAAMQAGFGWELGPFELWEAAGLSSSIAAMEKSGYEISPWVKEMTKNGYEHFYKIEENKQKYYNQIDNKYTEIPGTSDFILLNNLRKTNTVWKNAGTTITDIGDGILNVEFHTKMNSIGGEIIAGVNKAIDLAEKDFNGLVISNEGANFSAGANVGMIFMMAVEQEWDELNFAIKAFQNTMMRVRYSGIPVVVAPHNMALGGSCEMSMHADKVLAHAETYMGLVEFGVGLIPGGGGTKEFALRLSDDIKEGDIELNAFRARFLTIGQAQVSTSAHEAFDLGYLRKGCDEVVVSRNRLLSEAKTACMNLVNDGYVPPVKRKDIRVLGRQGLGLAYLGADSMLSGHYISEHDALISQKLAWVLCGGDLSQPTLVSEQYLLDLEREAFLSLCGEKKTLQRLQSILTGGKILRN
jgi:3-hydroxyacyl-CoA dehydrogenase